MAHDNATPLTIEPLDRRDLFFHPFGNSLVVLYRLRRARGVLKRLVRLVEPDEMRSGTMRRILQRFHNTTVGAYSYGCCMIPGHLPQGLKIGRYVSMARDISIFRRNHPLDHLSLHPYFYNTKLGSVDREILESVPLEVGHDAWIGHDAKITTSCRRIGIGSVIGTGSVVTKDVPDFAIVGGSPAKIIKYRFPEVVCERILESRWWERPVEECLHHMQAMTRPLDESANHPLFNPKPETVSQ